MASRGSDAFDLSDVLSSGVMAFLVVVILGALAGLYAATAGAGGDGGDGATPEGSAAGLDVDGDGDIAADTESPLDPDAQTSPTATPRTSDVTGQATPGASPQRTEETTPPGGVGGDRNRGLFSDDDPRRIPSFAVDAEPRDVKVRTADLDGDGEPERVRAWRAANEVSVRVEHFADGRWQALDPHPGGLADRLMSLRIADLNRDGEPEVYTIQWVATEGESLSMWAYVDPDIEPMTFTGGCWDGSTTVGLIGALPRVPEEDEPTLAALCPEADVPYYQWPSALYSWRDGRWRFDEMQGELR